MFNTILYDYMKKQKINMMSLMQLEIFTKVFFLSFHKLSYISKVFFVFLQSFPR